MGGEILNSHQDYIKSLTTNDAVLKRVEKRPNLNTKVLARMSPNSAVENLDYKVANLQRKLNKLKYKSKVSFTFINDLLNPQAPNYRKKGITLKFF